MKIRVFTSFSGYDSQCLALNRLAATYRDFDYELVGWSEIDKYAIIAHNALFPQWANRNYGDISKIDWSQVPDFDLFTYSSPCQDFSQAGLQRGGEKGSGTRSSLLWECERAIREKRPKYLLMENVAALVSGKFIRLFNQWQLTLERYGYKNFAKLLNAKHYGVPQNRERIFMVSILDEQARYEFPGPMPLPLRLKDVLEPKVDERYYLKQEALEGFKFNEKESTGAVKVVGELQADNRWGDCIRQQNFVIGTDGVSMSITAKHLMHEFKVAEPTVVGWVRDEKGNVVKRPPVEVANTVTSGKRDNTQNYVVEPKIIVAGETDAVTSIHRYCREYLDARGISKAVCSAAGMGGNMEIKVQEPVTYRIRKLTERECFRLMDVDDADIDKIQVAGIINSQQYKMAGNSIVVACLYHIFDKMFTDKKTTELTLF